MEEGLEKDLENKIYSARNGASNSDDTAMGFGKDKFPNLCIVL